MTSLLRSRFGAPDAWSLPALLVIGLVCGRHGLNLLTPSVLQLLDPIVAMALATVGVFVGLSRLRPNAALAICAIAGPLMVATRDSASNPWLITLAVTVIAILVGFAGWLLVAHTDSEREQQVFVVGSLLLLGGSAVYLSVSALFAGLLAGIVWNVAGDVATMRIAKRLDYFKHLLIVLLLVAAGASVTISVEVVALGVIIGAFHMIFRPIVEPFPVSAGLVVLALAFDLSRGGVG